ncbi:VOC family protein [Chitinophaga polysaccharea]|uniref:VOC family protein n=1 Tax=Chitinophaga polysaccharea TaxID=1293035 RepID=UPI0014552E1E|nr:VOC family protein [Chitinophaga polysaccharea]NLR58130.1 VOC family protein [Chitinophaga polysaccharea]
MNLSSVRIITADIQRLVPFYEKVTGMTWTWYTPDFAELRMGQATLAIGTTNTLAPFGGSKVAVAANNHSAIIEFRVADVDKCYEALAGFLAETLVQAPTTMPWGNRSLLFRDPDGNLVNFFAPVTADAKQRLDTSH